MAAGSILASLISIYLFNFFGYKYNWYQTFWWYDIPMHIAGGAWVAAAFLYFGGKYGTVARIIKPTFIYAIGVVLLVGVGWEIFEYSADVFLFKKYTFSTVPIFILVDSLYDLANDIIGAFIVAAVYRLRTAAVAD